MSFDHILILALIQGVTEFIPVSSSGHLSLAHAFTDIKGDQLAMDVALHFGTLVAVMVYFRQDVIRLLMGGVDIVARRNTDERRQAIHIILASLPVLLTAIVVLASGLLDNLRTPYVIAWASIIFAVPLYLADAYGAHTKKLSAMQNRPALILGLAQVLALIPGASRSGITLLAARALGFEREAAAKFSMLMGMPVIFCFALFGLLELIARGDWAALGDAALGALLSAIFAFLTIDLFLRMTRTLTLLPFVIYRIVLGGVILMFI